MASLPLAPASAEQQAAFSGGEVIQLDGAAVAALALPGFTVADMWAGYTPPRYLVKRIIAHSNVAVLFGESGHFKSVIAIDMALCVACGREFHGIKVHRTGVLYIAGEGHAGIRKRVRAWLMKYGYSSASEDQPAIYITEAGADLMGNPLQLRATVEQAGRVLGCEIGLIVIDTLAANFGMGDENHAGDMQLAVRNARSESRGAAVLFVHHTGHAGDGKARERGSYALRAAMDCRMRAVYDEPSKLVELQFLRVKDDEEPQPIAFSWRKVPIEWTDEDGEELTSVVLERSDERPPASATSTTARAGSAGLGANQETVLKVLKRLYRNVHDNLEKQNRDPAEGKVLISGLRNAVLDGKYMNASRLSEAVKKLVERGLIRIEDPHIYLMDPEV